MKHAVELSLKKSLDKFIIITLKSVKNTSFTNATTTKLSKEIPLKKEDKVKCD